MPLFFLVSAYIRMYIGIVCRYVKCYNLVKSLRVIVGDLCFIFPTDYSQGFGGKFGVQKDRQDKAAAGWDHIEKVEKHESQKGMYMKTVRQTEFLCCFKCWSWGLPLPPLHLPPQASTPLPQYLWCKILFIFEKPQTQYHDNDITIFHHSTWCTILPNIGTLLIPTQGNSVSCH